MTTAPSEGDADARARLRGKRVALGVVFTAAISFIGASAVQIIPAVFGAGVRPLPSSPPGSSARVCAEGVRGLLLAIGSADPNKADPNKTAPPPEWERVEQACGASPEGLDAWAALMRLRSAAAQIARPQQGESIELDPLRRDVAAHLPAELR
jgi:hypothetical protein